jgi:type IV pilus assembly protein PilA
MKKVPAKKSKKGFTLIELVVVIAILGILAAILIPVIGGFITRANTARDEANARNLYNCIAMVLATDGAGALPDSGTAFAASTPLGQLFGAYSGTYTYTLGNNDTTVESVTFGDAGVTYSRASLGS